MNKCIRKDISESKKLSYSAILLPMKMIYEDESDAVASDSSS